MIARFLPLLALAAATPAAAQDVPGTSPLDYNTLNRVTTSTAIDGAALRETARGSTTTPTRPRAGVRRAPARPARSQTTRQACAASTPILKSMGLPPHSDCL